MYSHCYRQTRQSITKKHCPSRFKLDFWVLNVLSAVQAFSSKQGHVWQSQNCRIPNVEQALLGAFMMMLGPDLSVPPSWGLKYSMERGHPHIQWSAVRTSPIHLLHASSSHHGSRHDFLRGVHCLPCAAGDLLGLPSSGGESRSMGCFCQSVLSWTTSLAIFCFSACGPQPSRVILFRRATHVIPVPPPDHSCIHATMKHCACGMDVVVAEQLPLAIVQPSMNGYLIRQGKCTAAQPRSYVL